MYQTFADKAFRRLSVAILLLFSGADSIFAAELTIEEAAALALKDDITLQAVSARSQSMPQGSPGMESLNPSKYKILSVDDKEEVEVYAARDGQNAH